MTYSLWAYLPSPTLRTPFSHHRVTNRLVLPIFKPGPLTLHNFYSSYLHHSTEIRFIQNYGDYTFEEFKFSHGYWSYIKDTVQRTNFHLLWLYSRSSFFLDKRISDLSVNWKANVHHSLFGICFSC